MRKKKKNIHTKINDKKKTEDRNKRKNEKKIIII